jgi:Na+/phosphate symporter
VIEALISPLVIIILVYLGYLAKKRNTKKTEQRKLLECVYNPMETAITKFHIEFGKDKLNRKQQYDDFYNDYMDVKQKYGDLIDQDTVEYINQLHAANNDLDNPYTEENFGSLEVSIIKLRSHLGNKIREINKKSLLRFFII